MATRSKKATKKVGSDGTGELDGAPESIEQVRDILFGGQMRAVESRLARMEERFHREHKALRAEFEKRLAQLEQLTKREFEAAGERLKDEGAKRADDVKALRTEARSATSSLDKRLGKLDEATSAADSELRTQMVDQGKVVADRLEQLAEEFTTELDRAVTELRGEKADTAALLDIFSHVAVRLTEELQQSSDA
jgi:hypothetical protein